MTASPKIAVVFAYHTVGVKCLKTLIENGFQIPLVITHHDNPNETIWFESVKELCDKNHIPTLFDPNLNDPILYNQIQSLQADYLFSFYFRQMIPNTLLALARIAPLNMHGSLLPKYRGRVPINWAVLNGEKETGATLHIMETKPDAGDIVSQVAVPIGPDQTAHEVFMAVSQAAQLALTYVVPNLLKAEVPRTKNDLSQGSYYGGRKPEDGLIDWHQSGLSVYNLYRAVAPPYPGAYTLLGELKLVIAKASYFAPGTFHNLSDYALGLAVFDGKILGICADGGGLIVQTLWLNQLPIQADQLQNMLSKSLKRLK